MKRLFLTGLSIVAISLSIDTSAQARGHQQSVAQPISKASYNISTTNYITPFELAGSAYQGGYRMYSIPGFSSLIDGVRAGRITAKDLVKAAIAAKNLSPETIDDRNYISSVEFQLRSIKF